MPSGCVLNGRFSTQPVTGVQRFAWEVLRALHAGEPGFLGEIALPADADPVAFAGFGFPVRSGRLNGHGWEQLELPRLRSHRFLVNLCNVAPVGVRDQLVVLHDIAFIANPFNFSARFRWWYRFVVAGYLRRGARVATVSRFSAGEISRAFGIPPGRIHVLSEGAEHIFARPADDSILRRHGLERDGYVLAVSSRVPNKNFAAVAKAAAALSSLGIRFVVAGNPGAAKVFADAGADNPALTYVGFVEDAQLRALYEQAACFVFPSFYEGFGLPVLEAMSCGCPVIASNTSSLPELCGDAALQCDPYDPDDVIANIRRLMESPALRDELRAAGLERSRAYSWRRSARELMAACE